MRSALAAALLTSIAAAGGQTPQLPALDRGAWGARDRCARRLRAMDDDAFVFS